MLSSMLVLSLLTIKKLVVDNLRFLVLRYIYNILNILQNYIANKLMVTKQEFKDSNIKLNL